MKNVIKSIVLLSIASIFTNCVKEDYGTILPKSISDCVNPGLTANKSVVDVYNVAISPSAIPPSIIPNTPIYATEDIVEAYMVSSDEGGNFYQSMYFQPLDGSKGFNISAEIRSIYNKIEPGRKVFLKMKDLAYANQQAGLAQGLIFGAKPTDKYVVDRIQSYNVDKVLIPSCDFISEDLIVTRFNDIASATNINNLNKLIQIDNVQFTDNYAGGTYDNNLADQLDASINFTDGTSSLAIRTSRYATFAGNKTPVGNGSVRGVLTKYGSGYQIILRTKRDVIMNNPRVIKPSFPIGGTNIDYTLPFSENFTSYANDLNIFPKYINDQILGGKYWGIKSYSGNKYLEMTSYGTGSTSVNAKSYFMVPVDFSAASSFKFKEEMRYYRGETPLKLYYVKEENFILGFLNQFNFTDITADFNITYPAIGTSENSFNSSGTYTIPQELTGKGFFIFEYTGTTTLTSTVQIDDIEIN
jgi:Family of unknown function (DUF5689)